MSEWQRVALSELANYINGFGFKPSDWSREGLRIIRIEQLNKPNSDSDYYRGTIAEKHKVFNGDLLFSWSATLKALIWKHGDGVLNQHLFKVIPKEGVDKLLLCNLLDFYMDELGGGSHGSTMKHIKRSELDRFYVELPKQLSEQRKISKILSTVDNLIEKTQALIDKYQSVKQGMMHDLFTRGVNENGQLRPSYEEAPHLYKESELGWIPKEWELCALEAKLNRIIDYRGKTPLKTDTGIPLITAKNVRVGFIDEEPREYIAENSYERWMTRGIPNVGDILFTTEAPLGNVAKVPSYKLAIAQRLLTLIPIAGELTQDFLYWLLLWEGTSIRLAQRSSGSTVLGIKQSVFRKIAFAFPTIYEQEIIAQSLESVNKKVYAEKKNFDKNLTLRTGLMQDLLTGKVRVKVDSEEKVVA